MRGNTQFEMWNSWLSKVQKDIQGQLINRHIYREVQDIIRSNPRIHVASSFYQWMANVYVTAAVMGVRRQLDMDTRSVSLARLLTAIQNNPEILSWERYASLYKDTVIPARIVRRNFDQFAEERHLHVDAIAVKRDLFTLCEKASGIRKFANKRVAQLDRSAFRNLLAYNELDDYLDYLEELLKKYFGLFRAEAYRTFVPVWQYDWKQIFRSPWIEQN